MKPVVLRTVSVGAYLFLMIIAIWAMPAPTAAHAILVSSTPKNNAVIKSSPDKVVLSFDARIEKRVSRVSLFAGDGRKVTLQTPAKGYTAGANNQLVVPIPRLKPGSYRLDYRVLAIDGHLTPGRIRFTILGGKSP